MVAFHKLIKANAASMPWQISQASMEGMLSGLVFFVSDS